MNAHTTSHIEKSRLLDVAQAEIDALEAELRALDMEEKLSVLKLEVARRKDIVKGLQNPMHMAGSAESALLNSILKSNTHPQATENVFVGMPSYRAFLGLGAGVGECQYYDIVQFMDTGMSGLGVAKGKCAVSKTRPDKISPDWDDSLG